MLWLDINEVVIYRGCWYKVVETAVENKEHIRWHYNTVRIERLDSTKERIDVPADPRTLTSTYMKAD